MSTQLAPDRSKTVKPLVPPERFLGLEEVTHLCTGGECPWLRTHQGVYEEFARLKGGGRRHRHIINEYCERGRRRMAELWGVPSDRLAFMPSCAEGMSWLARGLEWNEGDNVVTTNLEFPSVAYAWRNLRGRGVEVRLVPHRDWNVHEEDLLAAVDRRTRVLAVSHVSFYTGQCLDVEQIAEGLRPRSDALLALDATHSSGVLGVPARLADVTMSCSYKFMLATHGVAPYYMNERAESMTRSSAFGWHNLTVWPEQQAIRQPTVDEQPMPDRLEPGNLSTMAVMHLDHSLELLLSLGVERISRHARTLSEQVSAGLEELGFRVISPRDFRYRSGNTSFLVEDAEGMHDRLAELGVHVWGEHGRVRVTTHVYNGSDDLDALFEALAELA